LPTTIGAPTFTVFVAVLTVEIVPRALLATAASPLGLIVMPTGFAPEVKPTVAITPSSAKTGLFDNGTRTISKITVIAKIF